MVIRELWAVVRDAMREGDWWEHLRVWWMVAVLRRIGPESAASEVLMK